MKRMLRNWIMVGSLLLACIVIAGAQVKEPTVTAPASVPAPSYVGFNACKGCHAKVYDPWTNSPHGKALTLDSLPAETKGCEACHGPASLHISSGAQSKPRIPKADDAKAANAVCGACHFKNDTSKAPEAWRNISSEHFARSMHGRKGLACVSCHAGHPNGNDKQLIKPASTLCLSCHGQVLESSPGKKAAYTHSPVLNGQCLTCHDPHGASDRQMLVANIQKVCIGCHDVKNPQIAAAHKDYPIAESKCAQCHDPHSHDKKAKLVPSIQHAPYKKGNCEMCHTKPVAGQPIGLVKPAKELCASCHPISSIVKDGENAHLPVKEGQCIMCHSPHVSREKALLKAPVAQTCFACHGKIEDATVAEHLHKILDTNMNCSMCHKPHSSAKEKLLVNDEVTMCGQCHKHSFSHPIAKKADGTIILDPTTGKMMICSSCHDMHGSKFESLTKAEKTKELCVRCHSKLEH